MKAPRIAALVGNPNAGKSALFNALTGARQKIANYTGVTVERKAGRLVLPSGEPVELIDLPGSYSFDAASPDEEVTRKVVHGEFPGEPQPQVLVVVLDEHGRSDFAGLVAELEAGRSARMVYMAFDLLWLDGHDVRALPLLRRKQLLGELLRDPPGGVRCLEHLDRQGPDFHAAVCAMGLEGTVSKRADAPYRSGRTENSRRFAGENPTFSSATETSRRALSKASVG